VVGAMLDLQMSLNRVASGFGRRQLSERVARTADAVRAIAIRNAPRDRGMSTTSSKRGVGPEAAGIRVTAIVRWELWTAYQLESYLPMN
jgi:hypothetical protein